MIVLSFFGILQFRRGWREQTVVYLLILYFIGLHSVLAPEPRYRLPLEPFLILYAAGFVLRKDLDKEKKHP